MFSVHFIHPTYFFIPAPHCWMKICWIHNLWSFDNIFSRPVGVELQFLTEQCFISEPNKKQSYYFQTWYQYLYKSWYKSNWMSGLSMRVSNRPKELFLLNAWRIRFSFTMLPKLKSSPIKSMKLTELSPPPIEEFFLVKIVRGKGAFPEYFIN